MDIDSTGKTAAKRKQNRLAPAKCRARKRSNRTPCCFNGREQYEPSKKPAIVRKIRAGGLIKTANTKNPNLILQNVIKGRPFREKITFGVSTGSLTKTLNDSGTAKILFLAGLDIP